MSEQAQALYTGSCACGAIKYTLNSEPSIQGLCHCTSCRRTTSSAFSTNAVFPLTSLTVTSSTQPKIYNKFGGSGKPAQVHFCDTCSSALWTQSSLRPDIAVVKVGCLDGEGVMEKLAPKSEMFAKNRPGWVCAVEGATQMEAGFDAPK